MVALFLTLTSTHEDLFSLVLGRVFVSLCIVVGWTWLITGEGSRGEAEEGNGIAAAYREDAASPELPQFLAR